MKILQRFSYLKEMAEKLTVIKQDLKNCSKNLRVHLILIYLFRDNVNVNHWLNEVFGSCHDVSKCKNNNKYPKPEFIYESLWGYWEDTFDDNILSEVDYVRIKEKLAIEVSFDSNNLHNFLNDYFKWLSMQLSHNGSVRLADVKLQVAALLSKYSL